MSVAIATCENLRGKFEMDSEESRLIARSRRGDREAQEALVRRYQKKTYRLAFDLLGNHDDALDASQDTLIAMLRALPSFRGESRFETWLCRLTINNCLMLRRRLRARTRIITSLAANGHSTAAPMPDPEGAALSREVQVAVREKIRSLPEDYRTVIVLREIEGFAYDEIADILQIPVGTVQSRLSRARTLLRKALLADKRISLPGAKDKQL